MKKMQLNFLPFIIVLISLFIGSCKKDDDDDIRLEITSIDPNTARIGDTIVITGTGFSSDRTLNTVIFSTNAEAAIDSATTTQLWAVVPVGAEDGPITVEVGGRNTVSEQDFILDTSLGAPELTSIDPANGFVNTQVTITGNNFGEDSSVVEVYFNDTEASEITVTNTTIVTKIPLELEVGDVIVRVVREGAQSTSTLTFIVDKTPVSVKTVYWTGSEGVYKGVISNTGADISRLYEDNSAQGIEVDVEGGNVYWGTAAGQILYAPVDGEGTVNTLYDGLTYVLDIAIDKTSQKIFMICYNNDNTLEEIRSAELDGSGNMQVLYSKDINLGSMFWNIKMVVSNNKLYWTEAVTMQVMEGSVNGSSEAEAKVLFDSGDGLNGPVGVAVDDQNGKIYIVDNGTLTGMGTSSVFAGSLDGTGSLSTLVAPGDNVNNPNDAEIDLDNGYLFWMNGTDPGEVMRVTLDGQEVEALFGDIHYPQFFDLDIH